MRTRRGKLTRALLQASLVLAVSGCEQTGQRASTRTSAPPPAPSPSASAPPLPSDWKSASSEATTQDGSVRIRGLDGHTRHRHGGPAAQLGHFDVEVENRGPKPQMLTVSSVEYLTSDSCEKDPSKVEARPKFAGLFPNDGSQRESSKTLSVAPGAKLEVAVGFSPRVEAYYVFCDRFAFRAEFQVGGSGLRVVSEVTVTRFNPARR